MKNLLLFAKLMVISTLITGILSFNSLAEIEFSSMWQSELALTKGSKVQKFEHIWQPELNLSINDELDMTFIGRVRFDSENNLGFKGNRLKTDGSANGPLWQNSHSDFEIREWFLDTEYAGIFWRMGKQQVVWGQADGLKILDVINPQSYREFILEDFEDSRIPLWIVNAEIPIGDDDSLQLLWILDQSYHQFANNGSDYQATSPLLVPQPVAGIEVSRFNTHKPDKTFSDSEFGLRYSKFYQGWDLTFNYFYHYGDQPVFYQHLSEHQLAIDAKYKRSHLLGFSASKAFNDWTLRTEVGYNSNSYHLLNNQFPAYVTNNGIASSKEFASVIGIDWQGLEDALISIQWFQSSLFDISDNLSNELVRPKQNQVYSLMFQQNFANETWQLEVLTLYGTEQHDSTIQIEVSHMLESNIKLWIGADIFNGQETSLFGQFKDKDRLILGFEWGF